MFVELANEAIWTRSFNLLESFNIIPVSLIDNMNSEPR